MKHDRLGTLARVGGQHVLRFERLLPHAPDKVWRAVTEAAEMTSWFPAQIKGERAVGAELTFVFSDGSTGTGRVTEWQPPKVFAYTWDGELLRWEVQPQAHGCLLVFTTSFQDRAKAPRDASGWHFCLQALEASLENVPAPAMSDDTWNAIYEAYVREMGFGDFPLFLKNAQNRIATLAGQPVAGAEGYVFDGADGVQVALWLAHEATTLPEEVHTTDEYVIVLDGEMSLHMNGQDIRLKRGQEFQIPQGVRVRASLSAGSRIMHSFAGQRASRSGTWAWRSSRFDV